jgi:ribosomal protein S18 acetylase RimI-like enzyme
MTLQIEPPPGIALRPARPDDHAFARKLYLDSMGTLLQALGKWDEVAVSKRFEIAYRDHPSLVICVDGVDIGWLQISQNQSGVHLDQVHLVKRYRNRGIGSRLIRAVMAVGAKLGLTVTLNVVRGNHAIELYRRLGFRVVGEDEELLRMRWVPPARPRRGQRSRACGPLRLRP